MSTGETSEHAGKMVPDVTTAIKYTRFHNAMSPRQVLFAKRGAIPSRWSSKGVKTKLVIASRLSSFVLAICLVVVSLSLNMIDA